MFDSKDGDGEKRIGSRLTQHDDVLIEAGKTMLLNSIDIGRDFCKSMIGTAFGAIPIYLSLLKWFLPEQYEFSRAENLLVMMPVFAFLGAAMSFMFGFMPTTRMTCPHCLVHGL